MMIIGCDFHPSWQQVSWLDTETGETGERKLVHASGDAKMFYERLAAPVLIGMEATGNSQWFIELAGGPFKSSFDLSGVVRGSHRVGPLLAVSFSSSTRIQFPLSPVSPTMPRNCPTQAKERLEWATPWVYLSNLPTVNASDYLGWWPIHVAL